MSSCKSPLFTSASITDAAISTVVELTSVNDVIGIAGVAGPVGVGLGLEEMGP